MGMSKIVLAKETPEETGSIAKGGTKTQGGKDVKNNPANWESSRQWDPALGHQLRRAPQKIHTIPEQ